MKKEKGEKKREKRETTQEIVMTQPEIRNRSRKKDGLMSLAGREEEEQKEEEEEASLWDQTWVKQCINNI